MGEPKLKAMTQSRTAKVGHFVVEFVTPGIGHLLKNAGCDYVLFDTEHSGFHNETIKQALRYFEAADLPAIVRVPSKQYHHIARALDMGAEGIMVPMVDNDEEAESIVDSVKYTPRGNRGVALAVAHDNYQPGDVMKKLKAANDRSTLFVQIETAAGVENADAIAAIDGVDCLWVGHFDLSSSLGIPGQFGNRKFKDAIAKTYAACKKHKKSFGRLAGDVKGCVDLFGEGYDFICYAGDVWVFQAAVQDGVSKIRASCKGRAGAGTRKPAAKRKS